MWRRRRFLLALALAALSWLAARLGLGPPARAADADGGGEAAALFPPARRPLLEALADVIVPRAGASPAASEIDLVPRLERWIARSPQGVRLYGAGWRHLEAAVRTEAPFAGERPDPEELRALCARWYREYVEVRRPSPAALVFEQLRWDVLTVYYASPAGRAFAGSSGRGHFPSVRCHVRCHVRCGWADRPVSDPDVCVVGSGAGGAVAAFALCRRGLRVTLLETGPRFDPARYPTHDDEVALSGSPFEEVTRDPARRSYTGAAGQPLDPRFRHLASASPSGDRRPREKTRRPFRWQRVLGVGGTTLHYQGEAHRFPAHAFRLRSLRGVAADWPVDHTALAPFYARVERLLGVAGDPANPFKPPRGPYPYPAHPLSPLGRRVRTGARALGLSLLPNPVAILPRPRGARAACHYCNGCQLGCRVDAKGSVDVAVLPPAAATGRLRLLEGFHVTHLEHREKDGAITAAVGRDASGAERRVRAAAFVLAAGAIETPRLLLHSAGGAHPEGVGNRHDQVGRHLMETLYVLRGGVDDPALETQRGIPLDGRIWDHNGAAEGAEQAAGFVLGQSVGPFLGPVGYALRGAPGFGAAHREAMRGVFGGGYELMAIAEQLPRPDNRVTLAGEPDVRGVPLARVTCHLDEGDLTLLSRAWQRLEELREASGLAPFRYQLSAYDTPYATHVGGTCRMGDDRHTSVVDALGRVHGVPNLVIADASVLVTQGAGDSPSLTIQALALRAAEALAAGRTSADAAAG